MPNGQWGQGEMCFLSFFDFGMVGVYGALLGKSALCWGFILSSINMADALPRTGVAQKWSVPEVAPILGGNLGGVWTPPLCPGDVKVGFMGKVALGPGLNGCVGVLLRSQNYCVLPPIPPPTSPKLFVQNLCLMFREFMVRHRVSTQENQETHPGKPGE